MNGKITSLRRNSHPLSAVLQREVSKTPAAKEARPGSLFGGELPTLSGEPAQKKNGQPGPPGSSFGGEGEDQVSEKTQQEDPI